MFGFGIWEAILILAIVLLFFGGKKIPQLARGMGSAIRNFKVELGDGADDESSRPGELPHEDPQARDFPRDGTQDER